MVEQMEFEKSELEDEYEDLAMQFDGYQTPNLSNDSLTQLLSQEQQRVRDLLEELRITKATNARRIAELKKELATVRQVMVSYVHQIDSLNQTNQRLTAENKQVREQYAVVQQQAEELQQRNTDLTEKVTRASMLEITAFKVEQTRPQNIEHQPDAKDSVRLYRRQERDMQPRTEGCIYAHCASGWRTNHPTRPTESVVCFREYRDRIFDQERD